MEVNKILVGDALTHQAGNKVPCGLQQKTPEERAAKQKFERFTGSLPEKCLCLIPQRFAIEMVNRGWTPFGGAGTVGVVAAGLRRDYIMIDLQPDYIKMAKERISAVETSVPVKEQNIGQISLFPVDK